MIPALPLEKRELVLQLKRQGRTYREIEKETGISHSTITKWLRRAGLTTRGSNQPPPPATSDPLMPPALPPASPATAATTSTMQKPRPTFQCADCRVAFRLDAGEQLDKCPKCNGERFYG